MGGNYKGKVELLAVIFVNFEMLFIYSVKLFLSNKKSLLAMYVVSTLRTLIIL